MAKSESQRRKKPADVPFDPEMTDATLDRLVSISAFAEIDEKFRKSTAFRNILRMHSRLVDCENGDIIVREGDWGNSAFFIISGSVVVELEPPDEGVSAELLGRRQGRPKSFLQSLAQLWTNQRTPEFRGNKSYFTGGAGVGSRGEGGQTRVYLQDVPAVMERFRHSVMEAGQFFGEIAALGRSKRTTTVFAKGDVELLEIRWQGLRDMMRREAGVRRRIDRQFRKIALESFFESSPVFRHLRNNDTVMDELVQQAQLASYGEYDRPGSFKALIEEGDATGLADEPLISREGDYPNGVIMIRSGLARVSRRYHNGHQTVSYLSPGQIFGLEELSDGWVKQEPVPFRYSLRAIGFLLAIIVPTPLVERYVLDYPGSPHYREQSSESKEQQTLSEPATAEINQNFVEFLVQRRIVNGTATMLIDMDRCTRCDECVRACASTHNNNPRFLRNGPVYDGVMVANACMHCQDPVCMIECPTGAITRRVDEGAVFINDETCVGCGSCSRNCPYEAIRMVEIRDQRGLFIRDESTSNRAPITKATKCDLCVDQLGGPSCQRACPHDAMIRMDMTDMKALAKWRGR